MWLRLLKQNPYKRSWKHRLLQIIKYTYCSVTATLLFKKKYRSQIAHGNMASVKLLKPQIRDYKAFWKMMNKPVETRTVELCYNLSGHFDLRIMPEDIFRADVEPSLNCRNDLHFFANKNIYGKWFGTGIFPLDYFHKVGGVYYDRSLKVIENINSYIESTEFIFPVVLKPSTGSSGGKDIYFLQSRAEIARTMDMFDNLVVQEELTQHSFLSAINPAGINSVRVCIYRSVSDHSYHVLNASLRMGKDGSLDNETAGGIVCNINDNGSLNHYAVDRYGITYSHHPNTGFVFQGNSLPYYENLSHTALEIARQIPVANLISLDLCLDIREVWRCLEVNLNLQTIRFAQYAGKPFFREFTEEVMQYTKKHHWALH